ncbi:hypothetical protein MSG28_008394 [Choristoneura fumiferana]|uniref:Uncharacterized protein n=1 Tax=Choristoneura fumiferana TaxID=7141 RepID=A0ACC0J5C6_CHOFU|nr:hypothetical protein MSG28_008394 [Choristoneura fumiferana]
MSGRNRASCRTTGTLTIKPEIDVQGTRSSSLNVHFIISKNKAIRRENYSGCKSLVGRTNGTRNYCVYETKLELVQESHYISLKSSSLKPSHILSVFWPCSKEPQSEPCLWQRLHLRGLGARQPLGPRLPLVDTRLKKNRVLTCRYMGAGTTFATWHGVAQVEAASPLALPRVEAGHGKTHKDAASVRATHPIPAACGLYYFEVRIVSKGRDGYMGIGLSAHGVNMNRLPGWDKNSYGYHGDDGHSFCSSGTGQPYGPTFTTGDVIGCGVNLVDNTCFYTKNGHHLGIAFRGLPPNLYPTVGLQTPGEVVDANFGQQPFVFDIEDMLRELRARTRLAIDEFPLPDAQGQWQQVLHRSNMACQHGVYGKRLRLSKSTNGTQNAADCRREDVDLMVSTYLVHHGYCSTAQAFSRATAMPIQEDITSIKNRQKISKLVIAGRIGEAVELTRRLYPGLLERERELLFLLQCRQFVEMVNGTEQAEVTDHTPSLSGSSLAGCSENGASSNGVATSVISHTSRAPRHTNGVAEGATDARKDSDVDMSPSPPAAPANGTHHGAYPNLR